MSSTRRRLDDLKTRPASSRRNVAAARPRALPMHEVIGGRERRCAGQRYWYVETPFGRICSPLQVNSRQLAAPLLHNGGSEPLTIDPRRAMVLDIETGGFAGTPVFLIGVVLPDQRPLRVVQLLARDYPEEETILRALGRLAARRDTWITFNGKSFDEPFLRDRATLHRVPLPPVATHFDLLHAARRQWRRDLPDCRLSTLEEHILRRPRVGDVPSSDVPDLFHHFIRTGNAAPLRPVLEHNQIDLVSCAELLVRLSTRAG
jgi:uncharacterized protein YprB with RNaseH-like and TPR domain